jgi:hypothetical protein
LDHEDIVYLINREWKDDNTIVSCLGLLLNFYNEDNSEITLKLIEKFVQKGADVNRVLYKIVDVKDPLKILNILDTNRGVDVTVSLIVSRGEISGEKGGFRAPYDNFLTYTIIKQNIPVLEFILGKLDNLDRDKVVNCILSPNSYNTTSITAAMDIIKNDENVELEKFLEKYMHDERILIHGLKYAVKSDNLKVFMIVNRIISNEDVTNLLEGMKIPDRIQEAINLAPGNIGAKAAEISYNANKKPRITKFGAEKRRSNRRKVHLAPTRKLVVKRRSLKKK